MIHTKYESLIKLQKELSLPIDPPRKLAEFKILKKVPVVKKNATEPIKPKANSTKNTTANTTANTTSKPKANITTNVKKHNVTSFFDDSNPANKNRIL